MQRPPVPTSCPSTLFTALAYTLQDSVLLHLRDSTDSLGPILPPHRPRSASRRHRKSIGRSPHPPQTPAAQFKRSYRNCPGPDNRAQSCLVCRGSPDRNLTFHRTNPAKPPDCRRSRPNQHGHPAAASQFVVSTRPRVFFEQSTRSFPGIGRYVREKSAGPGRWLVDLQRSSSHRTEPALHYNLHRKVES
jgi:hypothetical protein